jgi:hypothetical protein
MFPFDGFMQVYGPGSQFVSFGAVQYCSISSVWDWKVLICAGLWTGVILVLCSA